jgi:hypothetical protein
VLVAGVHCWQGLLGLGAPADRQAPSMKQLLTGQHTVPAQEYPVLQSLLLPQLRRHPVELHLYGAQSVAETPVQRPPPSQLLAGVYVLGEAEQMASGHRCLGSAWPQGTAEQVPGLPVRVQVMHRLPVVPSLHAELQQTPWVQKPLLHWLPAVQAAPFTLRPHERFRHVLGATQSVSTAHAPRQALFRQLKVPQDRLAGVTQAPLPSQVDTGVCAEVPAQTAGLHIVPLSTMAQVPARQAPVVPQVVLSVALHFSCGSRVPSGTAVQVPGLAGRSHVLQASVQAELQQTPCAQNPDAHSLPALHSAPGGFFPHEPLTQRLGGTQSLSLVQPLKQALPLQVYGLHVRAVGGVQRPAGSQVAASVKRSCAQLGGPHLVPTG